MLTKIIMPKTPLTVVCIGDSLTYGIGWPLNTSPLKNLTTRMAEKYGWNVINLGISGQTTAQMNARKTDVDQYNPARVYVWGGVNDVYQGLSESTIIDNLSSMYGYFSGQGYSVYAMTIPPRDTDTYNKNCVRWSTNVWIREFSGVPNIIDAWWVIRNPADETKRLPAYAVSDPNNTSHITDAGFAAIVATI